MSLAGWFYKAFTPKQTLLDSARSLIKMIENDREAAKLMAKLDGIEQEIDLQLQVRTKWRNTLTLVINDWNRTIGNEEYKLTLHKIEDKITTLWDNEKTVQYYLRGKGINIAYRVTVHDHEPELSKDSAHEHAAEHILLALTKAGINALNPEVYVGSSILPQAYSHERSAINLQKA